jgi:hypothetical protein
MGCGWRLPEVGGYEKEGYLTGERGGGGTRVGVT